MPKREFLRNINNNQHSGDAADRNLSDPTRAVPVPGTGDVRLRGGPTVVALRPRQHSRAPLPADAVQSASAAGAGGDANAADQRDRRRGQEAGEGRAGRRRPGRSEDQKGEGAAVVSAPESKSAGCDGRGIPAKSELSDRSQFRYAF